MSLEQEDKRAAGVAKNPRGRVSLDDIKNAIAQIHIFNAADAVNALKKDATPAQRVLTICILTMHNGFTVIGKAAPADPQNFDPELGKNIAYEDAVRQVWPLMGFAKRNELMEQI